MTNNTDIFESWKYDYTESKDYSGLKVGSTLMVTFVICPKHGKHHHTISSTIPGYEGAWCQLCWLETLGPPFESVQEPYEYE